MHHLPHQLRTKFSCLLPVLLLLGGCAAPQKEFKPPVFPAEPEVPRYIYERTLMSSGDVEELTSAEKFKVFATGQGKRVRGIVKPYDVAVHQGRIYVSDTVQRAVLLFDIPSQKFTMFGTKGAGILSKPIGIDVSAEGEVYVVDSSSKRVVVYSHDGKYRRTFGGEAQLVRPSGLAVSGNKVFVIDTGGIESELHRVQVYNGKTGELLQTIGKRGSAEGEFNLPLMIDADAKGHFYVVDSGNFRVQQFDSEGKFVSTFGQVGVRFGHFSRPKGISVDSEGKIYVVDTSFGNFQIFNNEGQLMMFIGSRGERNEAARFSLPAGIDVDEDGRIYVVDQYFGKVEVFRPYEMKKEDGYAGVKPEK
ncbi:MAG: 6-bladed beta-propeller [Pseudomonadota bacterium]